LASIKDLFKGQVLAGVLVGLGSAFIIPKIIPLVSGGVKPVLKSALKNAIIFADKGKEVTVEMMEAAEDLWVEVKAEIDEEHQSASAYMTDIQEEKNSETT
jgi:hypothetical protein